MKHPLIKYLLSVGFTDSGSMNHTNKMQVLFRESTGHTVVVYPSTRKVIITFSNVGVDDLKKLLP